MLKMSEIKSLETDALDIKVSELKKELFEARMQKATAGFEKAHLFKTLKKDIARLLTEKTLRG